ncbi:hypothetical protein [Lysinibacillus parviboronicapiens]|uniref:hypothetical protein n=1 Tax=Lysinibacillus parviboronicapiens TaxID=436516 RepID=UPI000D36B479|nr:hypothetical protein [Lysinibacillus parviboronicapiens]
MTKNKYVNVALGIFFIFLLGVSFLINMYSYFNTKELDSASTKCYENDGEVIFKIHNNLTSKYSFECK